MSTVKIYRLGHGSACVYRLEPFSAREGLVVWDDAGKLYGLPEGYDSCQHVLDGERYVVDPDLRRCHIVTHGTGAPQLIPVSRHNPVLKEIKP